MRESKRTDVLSLVVDILHEYSEEKLRKRALDRGITLPKNATKEQIMIAIAEDHLRSGQGSVL